MYGLPAAMTFDCYGTLIDWEGEIQRFFAQLLAGRKRTDIDVRALQQHWEAVQFQYIQGSYHSYRQVLRATMKVAFEDFKLSYSEEEVELFVSSMGQWQPFPDTHAALCILQKYMKLVLITNTDDAIIAETEKRIGITFDEIVTAEQARAYKPAHTGFHLARQRLGLEVKDIWHAGFGFKYDIIPAHELGYTTIWVNRQGLITIKKCYALGSRFCCP